tara:strand:+ start:92 stop:487 length:396 start_codon:yes stop_codon:yes gene_type:complete
MKGFSGFKESPVKQVEGNFNMTGSSADTFKKTTERLVNKANAPKNFNMTGTSKAGKFAEVAAKKGAKEILKKIVPAAVVATTLYDMYESGQKHSDGKVNVNQKSFMADAKKNQKSIMKEGKKTKSILNKKK